MKAKETKKMCNKELELNDYKKYLLNNEIILKSQQRLKSEAHYLYSEEIHKIALSSNDDKRLQTFDKITSYPYGASVGKICKTELLQYINIMFNFNDVTNQNKIEHSFQNIHIEH